MSVGSTHRIEYLGQVLSGYLLNVLGVHFATALHDRKHGLLVSKWAKSILSAHTRLDRVWLMPSTTTADIRFIRFDYSVHALWKLASQRIANSVGHEPSGLVLADVEVTHKLMRAHAFLTGCKQVYRQ